MIRVRRASTVAIGGLLVAACAAQPDEVNLRDSFADQIASVAGVQDFERDGDELRFSGPDGRGGLVEWRVRIDSTKLTPSPDERMPFEGHIASSWWRDGELIEPLGGMSGLPDAFLDPPVNVAQACYALWDATANAWGW